MIHLSLQAPQSAHAREERAAIVQRVLAALHGRHVPKRRYRVEITLRGRWDSKKGDPLERNTDRVVQVLLDAMAEAFGWGTKGRADCYLDRDLHIKAFHEPECEIVEIMLWPT